MAKYVKNDVPSGYSTTQINDELAKIDAAIDDQLDRKGGAGNQMEADIDMNSNDLLNTNNVHADAVYIGGQRVVKSGTVDVIDSEHFSSFGDIIADTSLLAGDKGRLLGVGDFEIVSTNPSGYYEELSVGGLYVKPLGVWTLSSLKDIDGISLDEGLTVKIDSFHDGWAALATRPRGAGTLIFDGSADKADHDGGIVIDPARIAAWAGTTADLSTYFTTGVGSGCFIRQYESDANIDWWGAVGNATTYDHVALQQALDTLEQFLRPGGILRVPKGNYLLGAKIRIGGYTTLKGESAFSSSLIFDGTLSSGDCIELGPDQSGVFSYSGSYVFGSRLEDLDINASNVYRGANNAVISSVGAHQPSGIVRCNIRNFVSVGFYLRSATGGMVGMTLEDANFQGSTSAPSLGSKIGVLTEGGGAQVRLNRVQVESDNTNPFDYGFRFNKDHVLSTDCHVEGCLIGMYMEQNEGTPRNVIVDNFTANSTVPSLIVRAAGHFGNLTVRHAGTYTILSGTYTILTDNKEGFTQVNDPVDYYNSAEESRGYRIPLGGTLTIAAGVVTATRNYHTVDTEAAAATDDLDTINGGIDGQKLVLRRLSTVRTVVIKHGTGNISTKSGADVTLSSREQTITLLYDGSLSKWLEV